MKEIAVAVNNESNQDVYVWQVGEDDDVGENFPELAVVVGFTVKLMDGQTSCCMSQGQGHEGKPYAFRLQIADLGLRIEAL
jgi:hypothetical protein